MKIILQESYMNLGEAGEIINVRPGYARNFLLPQKIALTATAANVRRAEDQKKGLEAKRNSEREKSEQLLAKLKEISIVIKKRVGDDGKLFGSVTAKEIEEFLKEKGHDVDRRMIVLGQQIKLTGEYSILIKLVGGLKTHMKLSVESDAPKKKSEDDHLDGRHYSSADYERDIALEAAGEKEAPQAYEAKSDTPEGDDDSEG